ncbi:MAG: RagB/SusD family nutrient uptake outer membrane protein [Cytophagales bacterium]|nr:RagB/SusD family nutrient uptake outer membrane protein [Cytophagales bacterium]
MKNFIIFYFFLVLALWSTACDHLEVKPVDLLTDETAITDASTAESALLGLYHRLQNLPLMVLDLVSDESNDKIGRPDPEGQLDTNSVLATNFIIGRFWSDLYGVIHQANFIFEHVQQITTIEAAQREAFLAEALFIRGFCYLLLTKYFGDIPLVLSTDVGPESSPVRASTNQVFEQVIEDLQQAEAALPVSYDDLDEFKTRVTQTAAIALLARVYLYKQDWGNAEESATQVIERDLYQLETDYTNLYNKNSPEVIWELFYSATVNGNSLARTFFPRSLGGVYFIAPSNSMIAAFEPDDQRFDASIRRDADGTFYVYKYREPKTSGSQDRFIFLRLSELYLIRAEARAQLDNLPGTIQDVNVIRNRAGLSNTGATGKEALLLVIEQERFVEFCFENHRFADLVRTGRVDAVLGAHNALGWQPSDQRLPIPQNELILNPNLTQNEGY